MNTKPNDAAFARPETAEYYGATGLTKREYFASAVFAHMAVATRDENVIPWLADFAVKHADALIEALNAGEKE